MWFFFVIVFCDQKKKNISIGLGLSNFFALSVQGSRNFQYRLGERQPIRKEMFYPCLVTRIEYPGRNFPTYLSSYPFYTFSNFTTYPKYEIIWQQLGLLCGIHIKKSVRKCCCRFFINSKKIFGTRVEVFFPPHFVTFDFFLCFIKNRQLNNHFYLLKMYFVTYLHNIVHNLYMFVYSINFSSFHSNDMKARSPLLRVKKIHVETKHWVASKTVRA